MAKLGDVCTYAIGGTPSSKNASYYTGGIYPWVGIADMDGTYVGKNTKKKLTGAGVASSSVKRVLAGTILLSFKLTVGKVAIAECELYTNEAIAALTLYEEIDTLYTFYALRYASVYPRAAGLIGTGSLNKKTVGQIKIPLPPLEVQQRIAAKVSALAEQAEVLKKHARELRAELPDMLRELLSAPPEEVEAGAEMAENGPGATEDDEDDEGDEGDGDEVGPGSVSDADEA
jgi:restriction endonuclease S subunit